MSEHGWKTVKPGYCIPAGQPFRELWRDGDNSYEYRCTLNHETQVPYGARHTWEVDDSWSPPLDLPLIRTWGVVGTRLEDGRQWGEFGLWILSLDKQSLIRTSGPNVAVADIIMWLPLTAEQVEILNRGA